MIGAHAQQYGIDQKYNSHESDYEMDNSYDDKQPYEKKTTTTNPKIVMSNVTISM